MLDRIVGYNRVWHFGLVLAMNDPKFALSFSLKRSP
jgi:hypothetical protein